MPAGSLIPILAVLLEARNQGGHLPPQPKFSKHCTAIFTFAETFKEK